MSGLNFLNSNDFYKVQGTNNEWLLCHSIPGFSLILFYSTHCEYCEKLIPIFKKLPGTIGGCQFGMINVSTNKECVLMSKGTVTELKYVPYILLYIGGKPYMRYAGPHDPAEISRFVIEIAERIQNKQKFAGKTNPNVKQDPKSNIPAYSIGKPLCGPDDKVCYLEFDNAYGKEQPKQPPGINRYRNQLPNGAGMG